MDIFQTCLLNGVSIDMQWIPRDINSAADDISKFIDHDDYTINDTVCNALDDLWDPHTCDSFACPYNAKVQYFNTKILSTRLKWGERFLPRLVSPQQLIGFVPRFIWRAKISGALIFSAKGTLIVSVWNSAHFWPLLCSDGVHWSNLIHDWVILPNFPHLFIACKAKNSVFGCKPLLFVSVALRIDFPSRVGSESSDVSFIVPWQFCASSANFCRSWFSCIIYLSKFKLRV